MRVRINWPENAVLHNEYGEVVGQPERDELLVRLDRITPAMLHYEDSRSGVVTILPSQIVHL